MKKILKILIYILIFIIVLILGICIYNILKTPQLNRNWSADSAILPNITITENEIEVKNMRDWRYENGEVVSENYYDETFDLNNVKDLHLLFNPFGKWEGVGHFFFVFTFDDGKSLSISVEARREADESYSAIKGIFNEYELWYAFGSPADLITRRVVYNQEELYSYPLIVSKESIKSLLLELSKTADSLEDTAQFYNTVTANCTNVLADAANKVKPNTIPFHYSRLFTGFTDDQLYKLGFISNEKSFQETYQESRIDNLISDFHKNNSEYSNQEFVEFLY